MTQTTLPAESLSDSDSLSINDITNVIPDDIIALCSPRDQVILRLRFRKDMEDIALKRRRQNEIEKRFADKLALENRKFDETLAWQKRKFDAQLAREARLDAKLAPKSASIPSLTQVSQSEKKLANVKQEAPGQDSETDQDTEPELEPLKFPSVLIHHLYDLDDKSRYILNERGGWNPNVCNFPDEPYRWICNFCSSPDPRIRDICKQDCKDEKPGFHRFGRLPYVGVCYNTLNDLFPTPEKRQKARDKTIKLLAAWKRLDEEKGRPHTLPPAARLAGVRLDPSTNTPSTNTPPATTPLP
ncbi:MAG: hypothetical protein LBU03_00645 [Tannerellaceae bacterium]|jgi:hypothetical protein|nr:hypothetical protein [Tannerellaceae bacterium]